MAELLIKIQSHNLVCTVTTPRAREVVTKFARRFVQYNGRTDRRGIYVREALKVYAFACTDLNEFRFHRNTMHEFKEHLRFVGFDKELYTQWETAELPPAVEVEFTPRASKLSDGPDGEPLALRETQESAVEYFTSGPVPRTKLVGIQTGKGKGITSMFALSRIGLRTMIVLKPEFIVKWREELIDILELDVEDIMIVRTVKHLQALIHLALQGEFDSKVVIISNVIYRMWVKDYKHLHQETLDIGYGCYPDELMGLLGVGVRMVDEVHKDFHFNFLLDLFTHVQNSWSMSATLMDRDGFMNKMYDIAYPTPERFKGEAYDKYVNYTALTYRFKDPDEIRYQERGRTDYSHNVFEQSIIKQPEVLANYLQLLWQRSQAKYMQNYQPGDRLIVFAASIEMCTLMANYLRERYPQLTVCRYVGEDPRENLLTPDIRVSTIGSAGTGHDIPNLTTAIMTTAINSLKANLQAFGRLRRLKSGRTPEFEFWTNADNDKHVDYHEEKVKLLQTVALHMSVVPSHLAV